MNKFARTYTHAYTPAISHVQLPSLVPGEADHCRHAGRGGRVDSFQESGTLQGLKGASLQARGRGGLFRKAVPLRPILAPAWRFGHWRRQAAEMRRCISALIPGIRNPVQSFAQPFRRIICLLLARQCPVPMPILSTATSVFDGSCSSSVSHISYSFSYYTLNYYSCYCCCSSCSYS